jgi:hypothetical protein
MSISTGKYNLIQIGSIYLTDTGLSSGTPCKTEVPTLEGLLLTKTGSVQLAIDRTPYLQIVDNSKKGELVPIICDSLMQSVYNSLIAAHQAALDNKVPIAIIITGDTGTFNLTVYPSLGSRDGRFPQSIQPSGEFQNGRIKRVTLNYITT